MQANSKGMSDTGIGRWTWLRILIAGSFLFILLERALVTTGILTYVPSLLLVGTFTVPVAFCAFLYSRRRLPDVPWTTLGWCLLWGGLLGGLVAGVVEYNVAQSLGILPVIAIGLIEEVAKLVVPAYVMLRRKYDNETDGVVLGAAAGAGFAAFESLGYGFMALILSGGDLPFTTQLLLFRALMAPATHIAWTGLLGGTVWAVGHHFDTFTIRRLILTFAGVVALHAFWDGATTIVEFVVLAIISLGWLLRRLYLNERSESHKATSNHYPAHPNARF
jgi:RsiW-degrading membrane proteinase PrsW (M82 family)